jgi:hypothetical protein
MENKFFWKLKVIIKDPNIMLLGKDILITTMNTIGGEKIYEWISV